MLHWLFHCYSTFQPVSPSTIRTAVLPPLKSALKTNMRVSLRSSFSLRGHQWSQWAISCSIITAWLLTMMPFSYCMPHTIIILKKHGSKKPKTMSVSADACVAGGERAHNGTSFLFYFVCVCTRVENFQRAAEFHSHNEATTTSTPVIKMLSSCLLSNLQQSL